MQVRTVAIAVIALGLVAPGRGRASESMPKAVAADSMRWHEMSAKAAGVMIAPIDGEFLKGPWSGLVRFPAGSKSGLHTHSSDMKVVIISGTWRYGPTTEQEASYGPGSVIGIPAGHPHTNSQPGEVLMYIEQPGKFDNQPVAASK